MRLMRDELILALAAVACASAASAGTNSWSLGGPGGGAVSVVSTQPTNPSVLLASAGNGMYRSADGGATWAYAGDAVVMTNIVWDPTNADRVFAVGDTRPGVFRSDDGGATFATSPGPANASPFRLAIGNDGTMYLADEMGHIYKSTNTGRAWTEVGHAWSFGDAVVGAIAVDPTNSSVVLATVNGDGTYRSTNGGDTWSGPVAGSPGSPSQNYALQYRLVFKPGDPHRVLGVSTLGLYFSDDGGVSWSHPVSNIQWYDVAFDAKAPDNVVGISFDGQIERSADGGATWPTSAQGAHLHVLQSQSVSVVQTGKLLVATSDGPMLSKDNGASFAPSVSGIQAESLRAFATAKDGTVFVGMSPGPFGVYRKVGGPWEALGNDQLRSRMAYYPAIQNLAVAPGDSMHLYAVGSSDSLMMSFNGGIDWTTPHPAFANLNMDIQAVVVDPSDENVIYVLTRTAGLWKSINTGSTFLKVADNIANEMPTLAIDPANSLDLYRADSTGVVYKSVDGGAIWNPAGTAPGGRVTEFQFDPWNAGVMYVVTQWNVAKSTDGGATWAALDFGVAQNTFWPRNLMFDPGVPNTLIVGNAPTYGYGFTRSVDGGAHWQSVPWQSVYPSTGVPDFYTVAPGTNLVIAGGIGTGLHEYRIGTDLKIESNDFPVAVSPNSSGTMTISVKNLGPFDAASPRLQVGLPGKLGTTPPDNCTYVAPNLNCTLPNMRSGDSLDYKIPYSVGASLGTGTISVFLMPREYELTPENNLKAIAVVVSNIADLELTSVATAAAKTNAQVTLTATIRNKGPDSSTTTSYQLTPPNGVNTVVATPSVGSCATDQNGVINCSIGPLAKDATATVTVTANAAAAGTDTWSGSVTGGSLDMDSSNNTVSSVTVVTDPPPPPPATGGGSSNGGGGGGGGGGSLDWLLLGLLGGALAGRRYLTTAARAR